MEWVQKRSFLTDERYYVANKNNLLQVNEAAAPFKSLGVFNPRVTCRRFYEVHVIVI
jgi:hypothetical protein